MGWKLRWCTKLQILLLFSYIPFVLYSIHILFLNREFGGPDQQKRTDVLEVNAAVTKQCDKPGSLFFLNVVSVTYTPLYQTMQT